MQNPATNAFNRAVGHFTLARHRWTRQLRKRFAGLRAPRKPEAVVAALVILSVACVLIIQMIAQTETPADLKATRIWRKKAKHLAAYANPFVGVCEEGKVHAACVAPASGNNVTEFGDVVFIVHDSGIDERLEAIRNSPEFGQVPGVQFFWFSHKGSASGATFSSRSKEDDGAATLLAFRRARSAHPTARWFMKADDDSFVFTRVVLKLLQGLDHAEPLYLGFPLLFPRDSLDKEASVHMVKGALSLVYASGGAGYILSGAAVDLLIKGPCLNPPGKTGSGAVSLTLYEDVNTALCLHAKKEDPLVKLTPVHGMYPYSPETYHCMRDIAPEHYRRSGLPLGELLLRLCLNLELEGQIVSPLAPREMVPISRHYVHYQQALTAPDSILKRRVDLPYSMERYVVEHAARLKALKGHKGALWYMYRVPLRFVVFRAWPDAGMGNRLLALVSCFLLALVTDRSLLVDWAPTRRPTVHSSGELFVMPRLNQLLSNPGFEWETARELMEELATTDSNAPPMYIPGSCLSYAPQSQRSAKERCSLRRRIITDTADPRVWTWANRGDADSLFPEEVLVVQTTTPFGVMLQENPYYKKRLEDAFGPQPFKHVARWLLRPSQTVRRIVDQSEDADLGLQVRTNSGEHDTAKSMTQKEMSSMLSCVDVAAETSGVANKALMIAADSTAGWHKMATSLNGTWDVLPMSPTIRRDSVGGIQMALAELFRLANAKVLVLNARSTFGHMATVLGRASRSRYVFVVHTNGLCALVSSPEHLCALPPVEERSPVGRYLDVVNHASCTRMRKLPAGTDEESDELEEAALQTPTRVGFLVKADGNVLSMLESAAKHLKGMDVTYILAVGSRYWLPDEARDLAMQIVLVPRDQFSTGARRTVERLRLSYVFTHPSDLRWSRDVGREILSKRVAMFNRVAYLMSPSHTIREHEFWRENKRSKAYLDENERGSELFSAEFYGGDRESFVALMTSMSKLARDDHPFFLFSSRSIPDVHITKCFNLHPPSLILPPDFWAHRP